MSGLDRASPIPTDIRVHRRSRILEIVFDDQTRYELSFEFLRVFTPSAEARGHGPGQEVLQTGKREIEIEALEPVGNYAIRPRFSDGHDSGIYDWSLLYNLGAHRDELWNEYLDRLEKTGQSRDIDSSAAPQKTPGCGHQHG